MSNRFAGVARNKSLNRVLITGASGFVGHYLINELAAAGYDVHTTDRQEDYGTPNYRRANITDAAEMRSVVEAARPHACVHLAAISFVPDGARDPAGMLAVNIAGTINLLEALRGVAPSARLLLASTSQIYGPATSRQEESLPLSEDMPCRPTTLYAISKSACENAALGYAAAYGLDVVVARPSNHTGPGQSPRFVAPAFAEQLREVAAAGTGEIEVGNLESVRDFSDVRDVVCAYRLLLERGRSGRIYNISSNRRIKIGELMERLQRLAGTSAALREVPELKRPTDVVRPLDTTRIREDTGWQPVHSLDDTLRDMLQAPGKH